MILGARRRQRVVPLRELLQATRSLGDTSLMEAYIQRRPCRLTEFVIQRNSRREKAGFRSPAAQSSSLSSVRMAGHSFVLQMN
jgi:hypothetical protein